jgi:hypothetical protein
LSPNISNIQGLSWLKSRDKWELNQTIIERLATSSPLAFEVIFKNNLLLNGTILKLPPQQGGLLMASRRIHAF